MARALWPPQTALTGLPDNPALPELARVKTATLLHMTMRRIKAFSLANSLLGSRRIDTFGDLCFARQTSHQPVTRLQGSKSTAWLAASNILT